MHDEVSLCAPQQGPPTGDTAELTGDSTDVRRPDPDRADDREGAGPETIDTLGRTW